MPKNTETMVGVRALIVDFGRVLVLKRSAKSSSDAGLWEFPGGKLEKGSATLIQDLEREVSEETGLTLMSSSIFEVCKSYLKQSNEHYPGYLIVQVVYRCLVHASEKILLSEEHDEWRWVESVDELLALEFVFYQKGIADILAGREDFGLFTF
jgi:8-oxo-dGTP diphosphatase